MEESIRNLLRSRDPQQRIQGIQQAIQKPNANTIRLLATIAQKDPDASVRDYARKAGQQLEQQRKPNQSREDLIKEANLFLDEANNAMFSDDVKEARTFARRAFKLAPELQHDDIARDIAVYVMKMNADEAIELLMSDRDLFELDNQFRKKMGYSYSDEDFFDRLRKHFNKWNVTWQDVLVDVGLYVVVITFPFFILLTLAAGVLASSFTAMSARRLTGQAAIIERYSSTVGYGEAALSLGFIFIVVIQMGLILFAIFAFQMVLTHFSANWFLGGDGSLRRLIHHALIPVTIYSTFIWLSFFLTPILYSAGMDVLIESGMMEVFNLIAFGIFIFVLSKTIGHAYQFDFGKGCLSLMFPYIVLFYSICSIVSLRFGTEFRELLSGR